MTEPNSRRDPTLMDRRAFMATTALTAVAVGSSRQNGAAWPGHLSTTARQVPEPFELEDLDISALQSGMSDGRWTAARLTELYSDRIRQLDRAGPMLRAILELNPDAAAVAADLDRERAAGRVRGPLHGIPVLVKDNVETREWPTTAGSLALKENRTGRDAPLVARIRAEGGVVLGKTNLSEWANIRSSASSSGWSGTGGQTRNPHAIDRNPCGSSSGSGAAVAAGMAWAAVGTETDGSITCPASANGIVGFKPTVGLVSRTWIVPISHSQDTAGPMARTVRDAAIVLTAIAGSDPEDAATREADAHKTDYAAALDGQSLKGARIGVLRFAARFHGPTEKVFDAALARMKAAGAILVEIDAAPDRQAIGAAELTVLQTEFKADLNAYLASTDPAKVKTRTLADLIAFNAAHADVEMPLFGQETFEASQATKGLDDPDYLKARETARRLTGPEGIDKLLKDNNVVALVAPTLAPAWLIDDVLGDRYLGGGAGSVAAIAGYPHLTVPMGDVKGLPVGLSIIGPAWSDARILSLGYAFEQAKAP